MATFISLFGKHATMCSNEPADTSSYAVVELVVEPGSVDTLTHEIIPCGWQSTTELSVAGQWTTCGLRAIDEISPFGAWYRVKVYTGGRYAAGRPAGGRLCVTYKVQPRSDWFTQMNIAEVGTVIQ